VELRPVLISGQCKTMAGLVRDQMPSFRAFSHSLKDAVRISFAIGSSGL
jgi:hypothetical protein